MEESLAEKMVIFGWKVPLSKINLQSEVQLYVHCFAEILTINDK